MISTWNYSRRGATKGLVLHIVRKTGSEAEIRAASREDDFAKERESLSPQGTR